MSNRTRVKRKARTRARNILRRSRTPKKVSLVEDTKKYLEEWKKLFEEIDPSIEVFIDENELDWSLIRKQTKLDYDRLDGLEQEFYMLVCVYLPFFQEKYLFCPRNIAFEESSVIPLSDPYWLDTITETVTWQKLYERLVNTINHKRSQIPKPVPIP